MTAYLLDQGALVQEEKEHLSSCDKCSVELGALKQTINILGQSTLLKIVDSDKGHLADDIIIGYVNNTLGDNALKEVEDHLNQCGQCMRSVLSYRVKLAQKESTQDANGAVSVIDINVPGKESDSGHPASSIRQGDSRSNYLLPVSIAASVVLAIALMLVFNYSRDIDSSSSVATIAPDRNVIVQNIDSGTAPGDDSGTSVSGIVKVSAHHGQINWYQRYVETTAVGTVDMAKMKNKIQAESAAELTARVIAYSQLAEILQGIYIHKKVSLKDLLLADNELTAISEGFIKGAQVIEKSIEWIDDAPKAIVTLRAPLYGNNSLDDLIRRTVPAEHIFANKGQQLTQYTEDRSQQKKYTGVIVDARNINYVPALYPTIKLSGEDQAQGGLEIVPVGQSHDAGTETAADIQFSESINAARRDTGAQPLIVKAKSNNNAVEPGSIEIGGEDASKLQAMMSMADSNSKLRYAIVF